MRTRRLLFFAFIFLLTSVAFAQPPIPLPAPFASRGQMLGSHRWTAVSQGLSSPGQQTVILPLSSGITLFSVPLRTDSQLLSDLLPNLPQGSRVWTWDAPGQQFVEGFDQELPFGQGAVLYVPVPTVITITGQTDLSTEIPVDLQNGWNLIGVPYAFPLLRSSQIVYSAGAPAGFNDAATQGDIQEPVFSLDINGYREIGANDSFEPMNAYWVFSNDAEMIEMQPAVLRAEPFTKAWALDKLGGLAVQFAANQLFGLIEPDPNQAVLDKLAELSKQITSVQDTQSFMIGQLANLERSISLTSAEIQQKIGEQPIEAVRSKLETQYDGVDPNNPDAPPAAIDYGSYMWFVQAGQDRTRSYKVTNAEKVRWDLKVLETEDYPTKFTVIKNAIIPLSGNGVLDNYAQQVVLGTKGGTLEDRYKAMQEYFNTLLGLQYKCMMLITSALNDLANNPESPRDYDANAAEQWRLSNYVPAIQKEVNRFRAAAETILVGSLVIGSKAEDAGVAVPNVMQDVVMPRADFLAMKLLQEPPGMTVRVLVSPDMNPNNIYTVFGRTQNIALPSTDSGLWKRISGVNPYDSWRINPALSIPEFVVTKDWLMYKLSYPLPGSGTYLFGVADKSKLSDYGETLTPINQTINFGFVDAQGNPAPSGTPFGTLVFARRASARTMLSIPGTGATRSYGPCTDPKAQINVARNFFQIRNCIQFQLSQQVKFRYGGAQPAACDWEMNLTFKYDNLAYFGSYAYIRVLDNNAIVSDLNTSRTFRTGPFTQITKNLIWQADHAYAFEMTLYNREDLCIASPNRPCKGSGSSVQRGALFMRFK